MAGDIFGDMVLEQAIADKTAMVQAEMEAAQQAELDSYGINGGGEEQKEEGNDDEEDEDPDFAMDEEEERMLRQMALDRMEAARAEHSE